jgi:hypothetical protein
MKLLNGLQGGFIGLLIFSIYFISTTKSEIQSTYIEFLIQFIGSLIGLTLTTGFILILKEKQNVK